MNGTGALVLGAAGLAAVGAITSGKVPGPAIFVGAGIAGTALLIASASRPELARSFAVVIFLTSLLTNGTAVTRGIANALGATS